MQTYQKILWRERSKNLRTELFESALAIILSVIFLTAITIYVSNGGRIYNNLDSVVGFSAITAFIVFGFFSIRRALREIHALRSTPDPLETISTAELQQMLDTARQSKIDYEQARANILAESEQLSATYQAQRDALTQKRAELEKSFNPHQTQQKIELYEKLLRAKTDHH